MTRGDIGHPKVWPRVPLILNWPVAPNLLYRKTDIMQPNPEMFILTEADCHLPELTIICLFYRNRRKGGETQNN